MAKDKPAAPTDATVSNRAIGAVTLAAGEDSTSDAGEPLAPPAPPAANAGEDVDAGAIASAFITDTLHTSTNCENGRRQQYCHISDWRSQFAVALAGAAPVWTTRSGCRYNFLRHQMYCTSRLDDWKAQEQTINDTPEIKY
jgi:hypothetical protein